MNHAAAPHAAARPLNTQKRMTNRRPVPGSRLAVQEAHLTHYAQPQRCRQASTGRAKAQIAAAQLYRVLGGG